MCVCVYVCTRINLMVTANPKPTVDKQKIREPKHKENHQTTREETSLVVQCIGRQGTWV